MFFYTFMLITSQLFLFTKNPLLIVLGAGAFVFETRLGCLSKEGNKDAELLIKSVLTMFDATEKLTTKPLWVSRVFTPSVFKAFSIAWDVILNQGRFLQVPDQNRLLYSNNWHFS